MFRWTKAYKDASHALMPASPDWRTADYPVGDRLTTEIPGFAESSAHVDAMFAQFKRGEAQTGVGPRNDARRPQPSPISAEAAEIPFASTGPEGHRRRLRDKLINRGADALADYELLEMLLFFAQPKGDTKPLAKLVINRFGSFGAVLSAPARELFDVPGLGEHSVAAIRLVQASAVRLARAELQNAPLLTNWDLLIDYLRAVQGRERVEQFRILFLDTRNRLLVDEAQAKGTVNHTPVYPREVAKRALELHATALILVHNHPSGDPTPSRADIAMTGEIAAALEAIGVSLHDHIIIGHAGWLSFRREGMLDQPD